MTPAIECWALTKRYGAVNALDGLSLRVEPGEFFGLLGPNGAGKSTFLKMLVGLVRPTSGWAQVAGFPPGSRHATSVTGYLPELFRFPGWMTGRELLLFHGQLLDMRAADARDRATEVLDLVGLAAAADRKISGYSKGMQQRVGLAQAVLGRPRILFLDEPTSALDPIGRAHVREVLLGLADEGTTIFLNSHLLTDVERICGRIAIVNEGRVVTAGAPRDLVGDRTIVARLDKVDSDLVAAIEQRFGPVVWSENHAEISIKLGSDEIVPELANFLIESGRRLHELRRETDSLEQAFLKLLAPGAQK